MKKYIPPKETLTFVFIAVTLMVISHYLFRDTFDRTPIKAPLLGGVEQTGAGQGDDVGPAVPKVPPAVFSQEDWKAIESAFDEPYVDYESPEDISEGQSLNAVPAIGKPEEAEPPVKGPPKPVVELDPPKPFVLPDGSKPKIAIIIDDMGMNRKNGYALIDMDVPLTLAFLPYAPGLSEITGKAHKNGHELMIHMPMEAMDAKQNLGGIALRNGMREEAMQAQLDQAFESFEGYVGLNNHMGSRLTQSQDAMNVVMKALKSRDLYFVDSKTIGSSVAGKVAWHSGLRVAERDVFLDHENTIEFVRKALRKTENTAKRKGSAIAIGHPKDVTLQGLKEWLPTLQAKGFEIVPASALVRRDLSEGEGTPTTLAKNRKADALVINPEPLVQSSALPPE